MFRFKVIQYDYAYKYFNIYNRLIVYKLNNENKYVLDISNKGDKILLFIFELLKDSLYYEHETVYDSGRLVRACKFKGKKANR